MKVANKLIPIFLVALLVMPTVLNVYSAKAISVTVDEELAVKPKFITLIDIYVKSTSYYATMYSRASVNGIDIVTLRLTLGDVATVELLTTSGFVAKKFVFPEFGFKTISTEILDAQYEYVDPAVEAQYKDCLLYTSPSPRD